MTIHNQLISDTASLDLSALITTYGAPHYHTKRNPVGVLNEVFWAHYFATFNEIVYENLETQFYQYIEQQSGIFHPFSDHLLRQQISNDILAAANTWPGYDALAQLRNSRHIAGVVSHLKGVVQKEGAFNVHHNYIHLPNGVLLLDSDKPKLVGFDPKYISRNSIPIEYRCGVTCPKFLAGLLAPLSDEDRKLLQKLFGMYLCGNNFLQVFAILQGASESGKSQLAIVARELIGQHNCAELRVAHLDDRFELGRYIGKILLIGADVAGDFLSHASAFRIKGMVGGDLLAAERKHSNLLFYMAGIFNILITCNSRLTIKLDSDRGAWKRRLLIIPYDQRKHAKNIPNFGHYLVETEGSGILNWALEGLIELNEEVQTHGGLILTKDQKNRTDALLNESEGIRHFVANRIKADPVADLTTNEIIEAYAVFCADPDRGWYPNQRQVERQLPDIMLEFFKTTSNSNLVRNNKRTRGYRNVTFI
jgi:phage/plasmid-associated DNA primase